jgi:hypothetical protein
MAAELAAALDDLDGATAGGRSTTERFSSARRRRLRKARQRARLPAKL